MIRRAATAVLLALLLTVPGATQVGAASAGPASSAQAGAAVSLVGQGAGEEPKLGHRRHFAPYGKGWGRVSPRKVYNGGAPSGLAKRVSWRDWGADRSFGRGKIALYRPEGGYYGRLGNVQLRAQRLGHCGRHAAYTRLWVRVADRPGEPVSGPWHKWAGGGSLCR